MFFTFFKLHKWFKIEQKVSYSLQDMSYPKNTHLKSNIIPILPFSIFIFRYNKTVNKWKITHMWRNISVWYLLMNLKNNYFFKKLLIWANIKCKNFNIYNKTLNRYQEITLMYQKSWWNDLQLLRYKVWQTEIGNYGSFFALLPPPRPLPPKNPKNQNFEKMKKIAGDTIILQKCIKNRNHEIGFLRYGTQQTEFFVILNHFLPFYPPNNPENQNFEKMKKMSRYIIILNMCTINENHMMYSSWDMEHNRQNFFSFWTVFCPFTPLTQPRKPKFWKDEKKPVDIIILHKCSKNDNHMRYGSWDMKHDTEFFVILGHFLPFYPTNNPKNQTFEKTKNKPGGIII